MKNAGADGCVIRGYENEFHIFNVCPNNARMRRRESTEKVILFSLEVMRLEKGFDVTMMSHVKNVSTQLPSERDSTEIQIPSQNH